MRRILWMAGFLAACGEKPSPQIDIVFPDDAAKSLTTGIVVTAIEPLVTVTDVEEVRQVVRCGELGVFPPTAKYSRDGSDVSGLEHILINRGEFRSYPLDGPWSLDIPQLKSSVDSNPWRAVMVHFEARGSAQPQERKLGPVDDKTLLEACFCIRLDEEATHPDAALDGAVKAACPGASTFSEAALEVSFQPVAPQQFWLRAHGISNVTTTGGQVLIAEPGLEVTTTRCSEGGEPGKCFDCSVLCKELDDKKNVPVRIEVIDGPPGTKPSGVGVVLSDKSGRVIPEIDVADCTDEEFTIRASIVGRPTEKIDIKARCVPRIAFTSAAELAERSLEIKGITSMPGALRTGGGHDRSRVAVISQRTMPAESVVRIYESVSSRLVPIDQELVFPAEKSRGIYGYYYELGSSPQERDQPYLVVATTNSRDDVVLRQYRWTGDSSTPLELVQTSSTVCPVCTCNQQHEFPSDTCDMTEPCSCKVKIPASNLIVMTSNDVNGDGLADLAVAADSDVNMTIYYSERNPSGPQAPPPFNDTCKCSALGKVLETYDLIQAGGPRDNPNAPAMDVVMGDGTGAFARYSRNVRIDGPPCETDADCSGDKECWHKCPRNNQCSDYCPDDDGRCVDRCSVTTPNCTDPLLPTCTPTVADSAVGFCAGSPISCGQPASVWRLINIHDVSRGRFTSGPYEDAIAVGAGSPVPGYEGTGQIRILFGSEVDLTAIDSQPPDVRDQSYVELVPRQLPGESSPPQGPRSGQVGDFNGDGMDDVAVVYYNSEEVRVWLGAQNRGPGELDQGIKLNECGANCSSTGRCFPYDNFVATDVNADGFDDLVLVCTSDQGSATARQYRLRLFISGEAVE